MSNKDKPLEPEILNPGGKGASSKPNAYQQRYSAYAEQAKQGSSVVFIVSFIALFLSLIPIVGVSIAIIAMILAKIKHTSMILALVAFIIGCISTTLFVLLVLLLRLLF